ncbi:unnamed protein product [Aphis gossypii]|uniref:G-protein coupled receptors family 1 profile domain-containing protein n=1 Tax=Aphis gossypii TaxID=80765 RepID=A0A9P0INB0_APHGO|nr:unnamed protein product [Aphis gossypii]
MSTHTNEDLEDKISLTDGFAKYYPLLVVCLGSLGNFFSVMVFFGTKLRNQSSSYYLSSLAISDTLFLLIQLMPMLSKTGISGLYHMPGFCQFFVYLTQICSFISVWLVVVFTSERFIAVRYPLHRSVICTVYRAKIVLCILITFALIVHIPYLVISTPNSTVLENNSTTTECSLNFSWYELYKWLNYADVIMNMLIPFFLIVIFNSMICQSVCRLARIRRTMTLHPSRRRQSTSQNSQHTSQIKVTEMLLVVSTVFLCLNLPSYVFRVWMVWDNTSTKYKTIQVIANQMYNTHFGINFVLYCVSGQNFRRALVELWNKGRYSNKRLRETQVTTGEHYLL